MSEAAEVWGQSSGTGPSPRCILVVDDDEFVRQTLTRILEAQGYDCVTASDVTEARKQMGQRFFDLVLCDIEMPGPSGLDLLAQISKELLNTATLMVTGVDHPDIARQAVEMGAYGYIVKPFSTNEIVINVLNALKRRDLEHEQRLHSEEIESKLTERTWSLRAAIKQLEVSGIEGDLPWQETIDRLSKALALRDEETGRHIERVGLYSSLLAEKCTDLPWSPMEIRHAAMPHDAGKIGIPDAILLKRGPLTDEERKNIERHAELGFQLLTNSTSPLLNLAANIALTHHEHWDGGGYPRRLRGEEIPIEGRITAIADVFDALTSNRVYRRAFEVDEALSMIEEDRGKHFDPQLVDLFLAARDEFIAIRERFPDILPDSGDPIKVLVVEDQDLLAEAMMRLLDGAEGLSVLGTAGSIEEAVHFVEVKEPDVVLVDWQLPDGTGRELIERIRAIRPGIRALVLTGSPDESILAEAIEVGCSGVLTKNRPFEDIVEGIKAARAGEVTIPIGRLQSVIARLGPVRAKDMGGLTERELEVLGLLVEGLSNPAIAERLVISLHTVRNHVQRILTKLDAHSKLEAVAIALRREIIEAPLVAQ
ncbi:MAG TPA: response regulator [Actinomycetota bacterium]|nr:response regulator [Actinomycetota bacterium]